MPRPDIILLDTSALLLPFEHGIDLQVEADRLLPGAKLAVPSPVLDELAHVAAQGSGSSKRHAKAALSYVVRFEEIAIGGRGDDALIQAGRMLENKGFRVAIATADQKLRFRARAKGWPVLTVKGTRAFLDGYTD